MNHRIAIEETIEAMERLGNASGDMAVAWAAKLAAWHLRNASLVLLKLNEYIEAKNGKRE